MDLKLNGTVNSVQETPQKPAGGLKLLLETAPQTTQATEEVPVKEEAPVKEETPVQVEAPVQEKAPEPQVETVVKEPLTMTGNLSAKKISAIPPAQTFQQEQNKELAVRETSNELVELKPDDISNIEFDPGMGLGKLTFVARQMLDSGLLPKNITEPGQVIAIGQMGHDLKISWMSALQHIDNIQGKPTLSYRLVIALLNRAGYRVKLLKNYATEKYDDGNWDIVTEMELIDMNLFEKMKKEATEIAKLPEDVRTFMAPMLANMATVFSRKFEFRYTDAISAKLMDKKNYQERPRDMFRARCVTGMVRMYIPEVTMAFYETSEIHPDVYPEGSAEDTLYEEVN